MKVISQILLWKRRAILMRHLVIAVAFWTASISELTGQIPSSLRLSLPLPAAVAHPDSSLLKLSAIPVNYSDNLIETGESEPHWWLYPAVGAIVGGAAAGVYSAVQFSGESALGLPFNPALVLVPVGAAIGALVGAIVGSGESP